MSAADRRREAQEALMLAVERERAERRRREEEAAWAEYLARKADARTTARPTTPKENP